MSESELIWKYIQLEFPDEHPAIYLYCCTLDNDEDVIKKIMDNLSERTFPFLGLPFFFSQIFHDKP